MIEWRHFVDALMNLTRCVHNGCIAPGFVEASWFKLRPRSRSFRLNCSQCELLNVCSLP